METLRRLAQALFLVGLIVLVPGGGLLALSMFVYRRNKRAASVVPAHVRDSAPFGKPAAKR